MNPTIAPDTRLYLASDRMTNAGLRALRGVFDGFWLGVLTDARIDLIDQAYYSTQAAYTSERYNTSGFWGWEQAALEKHFSQVRRIVVTSAGGGREVLALARSGYQPTGFEPHPALVEGGRALAAAQDVALDLRVSERDGWPSGAGRTDGVIVGWGGYMLIASRARRISLLRGAATALPDGGPILLSFFVRSGGTLRYRMAVRVANTIRMLLRREPIEFGDALVPNRAHLFSRSEIAAELTEAGFEMIDFGVDDYGWAVGLKVGPARPESGA